MSNAVKQSVYSRTVGRLHVEGYLGFRFHTGDRSPDHHRILAKHWLQGAVDKRERGYSPE